MKEENEKCVFINKMDVIISTGCLCMVHVRYCLHKQKLLLDIGMLLETSQFSDAAGGCGAGVAAADGGDLL